ncbi:restriction endonuclease subunit S [Arcanobacterium phocae]|uniref:restriction endonuclease subunit S n=1 Tax=Arcanobacterium phocae TaxID=131112 RepID=UPI001C0EED09|nr:restriction endonuclease subunit S [Arcanobacterium phocae]
MNNIEKMIQKLCPGKITYIPIGEIGIQLSGLKGKTKADFGSGTNDFVSYTDVLNNFQLSSASGKVSIAPGEHQNALQRGDIIFTTSSEKKNESAMSAVIVRDFATPTFLNSFCFGIRPHKSIPLLPEFSAHVLRSAPIRKELVKTANGVTRYNVSKPKLLKILLPLPPLDIQREIVQILDMFTNLEAELEAELEARKKQLLHAQSQLLTPLSNWSYYTLESLAHVRTGQAISTKIIQENPGKYPVINSGKLPLGYIDCFNTENDPIGITSRGAGVGSVTWQTGKYFRGNLNYGITIKDTSQISVRFLYHSLLFLRKKISALSTYQGIPALNKSKLLTLQIPVPPLDEQKRIADILDKFDALVNDISSGLPAEIDARRKQYEYYRDALLTFPTSEE